MTKSTQNDVMQLAGRVRGIPDQKIMRFVEAYLMMAMRGRYRPGAPGDGCGGIYLSKEECDDQDRLLREACDYAIRFDKEEDSRAFNIGCSDFRTNRAFVFSIEAARLLASGDGGSECAIRLLKMAIEEIKNVEQGGT
jgi:hypothetical protein